jgi:hypothetical protein
MLDSNLQRSGPAALRTAFRHAPRVRDDRHRVVMMVNPEEVHVHQVSRTATSSSSTSSFPRASRSRNSSRSSPHTQIFNYESRQPPPRSTTGTTCSSSGAEALSTCGEWTMVQSVSGARSKVGASRFLLRRGSRRLRSSRCGIGSNASPLSSASCVPFSTLFQPTHPRETFSGHPLSFETTRIYPRAGCFPTAGDAGV